MRYPVDNFPLWYSAMSFGQPTPYGYHEAEDINSIFGSNSDFGKDIFAIADGVVTSVHDHMTSPTFGRHMHYKIEGPWGARWVHCAHLNDLFVKEGDSVAQGQRIATVGKTGTLIAHLHFGIKKQPTGLDAVAKTLEDLAKWENPFLFMAYWTGLSDAKLEITDKTQIPQLDNQEVQTIKSRLTDMARDVANIQEDYRESIIEREKEIHEHLNLEAKQAQEIQDLKELIKQINAGESKPNQIAILITSLVERLLEKLGVKKG